MNGSENIGKERRLLKEHGKSFMVQKTKHREKAQIKKAQTDKNVCNK